MSVIMDSLIQESHYSKIIMNNLYDSTQVKFILEKKLKLELGDE